MKKKIKKIFNKYRSMNKALKASFWFVICGVMQRGITVFTTPIFTRLLPTDEYGIFSVFSSWLEIFTVICTFRLCYGIYMKGLIKYEDNRDDYSVSLIGLSEILIACFFLVYLIFHKSINNLIGLSTGIMFCMFLQILANTWFSFWSARQRVDYNYSKLIIVTIVVSILKPLFGITAIKMANTNLAYARIISLTIVELIVYVWLYLSQRIKSNKIYNKKYWLEAIKFNIYLVPHYLSQIILNHSDRIMIKYFCGYSDTGAYSLAYSLAMVLTLFNTAFLNTLTPWNYRQLKNRNYKKMQEISIISILIIAMINLMLILIAPEILIIFAPKSYHGALYVIPPVALGVYLTFLYGIFVNVEMYYDKNKYVMVASCCGAILNIILNYVFIPIYGFIAAAYTTLFSYLLYCFMHFYYVIKIQKQQKIKENIYNYKKIIIISIIFIASGLLISLTYDNIIIRYSIILLIAIIILIFRKKITKYVNTILKLGKDKSNEKKVD